MKRYFPSLNCYPSTYPALSGALLALLAAAPDEWFSPGQIYQSLLEYGEVRARNELRNLREIGFIRRDPRGYQLSVTPEEAACLFAYSETMTQRLIMADIVRKGFVYARQFQLAGNGDATQFLRAARGLETQGIIRSEIQPVPNIPHIKRRIYLFTDRAKKHD
ncbi:hypothetical protein ACSI5N_25680 (plasmid) [Raoultella ornithinolytica]|uniref:hypothetical protein n=1 Tax=Raoultella ornithinolytica TaxID=54291 RepID=UPI00292C91E6|nr:hypothetical protein [Raoultella ornithinolytica]MDV1095018.1 hypothetical protein [Raoultella ornithinolytica]MDV1124014.1 hypothetical protein [Raoultella ornithinolytica]MDV1894292.1 hypothetical protein [Raoultella ornithinolytica]